MGLMILEDTVWLVKGDRISQADRLNQLRFLIYSLAIIHIA